MLARFSTTGRNFLQISTRRAAFTQLRLGLGVRNLITRGWLSNFPIWSFIFRRANPRVKSVQPPIKI